MFGKISASGIRGRVLISVLLMLLHIQTGINAVNYYRPTVMKTIGYTGTFVNPQLLSLSFCVRLGFWDKSCCARRNEHQGWCRCSDLSENCEESLP